jgi:hypothetical protein
LAGSQSFPSPAAESNSDDSTIVYFSPKQPEQLDSDPARPGLVSDLAPLQPARTVLHKGVAAERDRTGEVMELDHPLGGLVRISSEPMANALNQLLK